MEKTKAMSAWACGLVLLGSCLLWSGPAEALNHHFMEGDSFFVSEFEPETWLGQKEGEPVTLSYYNAKVMRCGEIGSKQSRVSGVTETFKSFVRSLPNTEGDRRWIFFYPRGYDPSRLGFGIRYNEKNWIVDDLLLSDELSWLSLKHARSVAPLQRSEGEIILDKVDVYIVGSAELEDVVQTRKGMVVHRWRGGEAKALRFQNNRWRDVGAPELFPLSENKKLAERAPVFPRLKLNKGQLRKLEALRKKSEKPHPKFQEL